MRHWRLKSNLQGRSRPRRAGTTTPNKPKCLLMAFRLISRQPFLRATLSPCKLLSPRPPQLRSPAALRFFSSSVRQQSRRPYPHRQFDQEHQKQSFFRFLDDIPQNTVFWSIITINGAVFVMWFMASQRLVRSCYHSQLHNS